MGYTAEQSGTAGTPDPEGAISGALLRVIRTQLGLSQERAAEALAVDPNTIKSWETGRRPLARVNVRTLRAVTRALHRLGTDPLLLDQLDAAIDVDLVVGQILAGTHAPADHPLATLVHTREWHDLLAWALTGATPAALRPLGPRIPRPRLANVERTRLFDSLRTTAERADSGPSATLLRRQVFYIATLDDAPGARDWINQMERQELRRLRHSDGWTPTWVAGRSLAVARAVHGDPEHLRTFIRDQLSTDGQEAANLNYWAYWCGEETRPAVTDEFMATGDLGAWRGHQLLAHLVTGLASTTPYVELTIHTIWALIERRPHLLDDDTSLATDLDERTGRLLDDPLTLGNQARRELEQLRYASRLRRHRP